MNRTRPCDAICRAALARGPLVRDRSHWRFGRRLFNPATVARLIAAGEAVRDGSQVVAAPIDRP